MRTHYICHPTVPFPALSHIPSPLLHTSPSHHTPPPLPPRLQDSCPTPFGQQSLQLQQIPSFPECTLLCLKALTPSMNNTRATNTRANRSLSHERKTHSPPLPPSLLGQQAAHAIQGFACTPGCLWECLRTSHLEIDALAWPLAVPGGDRFATFTTAR